MAIWKIILISLAGSVVLGIIAGMVISNILKKRRNPDYKPVFNKIETILCLASAVIGIGLILGGIFLPNMLKTEDEPLYAEEDGDFSQNEDSEFDSDLPAVGMPREVTGSDSGAGGVIIDSEGAQTVVMY